MAALTHSIDLESGSTQYLSVADTVPLSIVGNLTIEAWINLESDTTATQDIATKFETSGNQRSYALAIRSTGVLTIAISSDGTNANTVTADSNYAYFLGGLAQWIHVAVTYNAAAGTCKFYINGVLDSLGSGLPTSIFNSTAAFAIGASSVGSTPTDKFDGKVRDVRVFASERTAAQILTDMLSITANGAAGHWSLNNVYTDDSGNGATLTPSGSPAFATSVPFADIGTTLTLQNTGCIDALLYSASPTFNYGNYPDIGAGEDGGAVGRPLVKFPFTSIPAGSVVNAAFLILTNDADNAANARVFNVYRVKRAWTEGTGAGSATGDGATWNTYDGSNAWGTAGCGNTTTDREGTAINNYHAQVASPDIATPSKKSILLDPAKIQEMIPGGVFTNNGFLLKVDNESADQIVYDSKENGDTTLSPKMVINYTPPGGGAVLLGM